MVKLLLEWKADLDKVENSGCTAFHMACFQGHADIAEELVRAGCNTTLRSQNGTTGRELAKGRGHVAVVRAIDSVGSETVEQQSRLQAGAIVEVSGLVGAPELNGCAGKILNYSRPKDRYNVEVRLNDGGLRKAALKLRNLTPALFDWQEQRCQDIATLNMGLQLSRPIAGSAVVLCTRLTAPELNNRKGIVRTFHIDDAGSPLHPTAAGTGRYVVTCCEIDGASTFDVLVAAHNCVPCLFIDFNRRERGLDIAGWVARWQSGDWSSEPSELVLQAFGPLAQLYEAVAGTLKTSNVFPRVLSDRAGKPPPGQGHSIEVCLKFLINSVESLTSMTDASHRHRVTGELPGIAALNAAGGALFLVDCLQLPLVAIKVSRQSQEQFNERFDGVGHKMLDLFGTTCGALANYLYLNEKGQMSFLKAGGVQKLMAGLEIFTILFLNSKKSPAAIQKNKMVGACAWCVLSYSAYFIFAVRRTAVLRTYGGHDSVYVCSMTLRNLAEAQQDLIPLIVDNGHGVKHVIRVLNEDDAQLNVIACRRLQLLWLPDGSDWQHKEKKTVVSRLKRCGSLLFCLVLCG